jgi:hypothetical protein
MFMKRPLQPHRRMMQLLRISGFAVTVASIVVGSAARPADQDYTGKLDPQLVVNRDDPEQVVFRPMRDLSKIKISKPPDSDAIVTAGRLYHAASDRSAIQALLVERQGEDPYLLADVDMNSELDDKESFPFAREDDDNPLIWQATVNEPLKEGIFQSFPLFVRYLKRVRTEEMKEGERLILESRSAFARGSVDIQGRKTIVQYDYNPRSKKISPTIGKLGVRLDQES